MFIKILLFWMLFRIIGNPVIAIVVLVVVLYLLDRRYIGILPNMIRPIQMSRRLARLKLEISSQPYNISIKLDAARILLEKKRYAEALPLLELAQPVMKDSADVVYELGLCYLMTGHVNQGEEQIVQALEMNPKVKYGEPHLRLGEVFAETNVEKAIHYLEQFRQVHSSSCEAFYLLGRLYKKLNKQKEARQAFRETLEIYKSLPKYKKKTERRWAILAKLN